MEAIEKNNTNANVEQQQFSHPANHKTIFKLLVIGGIVSGSLFVSNYLLTCPSSKPTTQQQPESHRSAQKSEQDESSMVVVNDIKKLEPITPISQDIKVENEVKALLSYKDWTINFMKANTTAVVLSVILTTTLLAVGAYFAHSYLNQKVPVPLLPIAAPTEEISPILVAPIAAPTEEISLAEQGFLELTHILFYELYNYLGLYGFAMAVLLVLVNFVRFRFSVAIIKMARMVLIIYLSYFFGFRPSLGQVLFTIIITLPLTILNMFKKLPDIIVEAFDIDSMKQQQI